jgi:hypothetical protein
VVDVFYVKDLFGHKVDHPAKLRAMQEQLVAVLDAGTPEPVAKRPRGRQAAAE